MKIHIFIVYSRLNNIFRHVVLFVRAILHAIAADLHLRPEDLPLKGGHDASLGPHLVLVKLVVNQTV